MKRRILNKLLSSDIVIYDSIDEFNNVKQFNRENRYNSRWWINFILKFVNLIIIFLVGYFLIGCTPKQNIIYEPVYVPTYCEVTVPNRPNSTNDVVKDNLLILKYAEELEITLRQCIK